MCTTAAMEVQVYACFMLVPHGPYGGRRGVAGFLGYYAGLRMAEEDRAVMFSKVVSLRRPML